MKHTEETKARLAAYWTPERRAQMSAIHRGKPKSPEHRAKLSALWTDERRAEVAAGGSADAGHQRARRLYSLTACAICGVPATDRHHIDGDPCNNSPSNIAGLCRRCHTPEPGGEAHVAADRRQAEALLRGLGRQAIELADELVAAEAKPSLASGSESQIVPPSDSLEDNT